MKHYTLTEILECPDSSKQNGVKKVLTKERERIWFLRIGGKLRGKEEIFFRGIRVSLENLQIPTEQKGQTSLCPVPGCLGLSFALLYFLVVFSSRGFRLSPPLRYMAQDCFVSYLGWWGLVVEGLQQSLACAPPSVGSVLETDMAWLSYTLAPLLSI